MIQPMADPVDAREARGADRTIARVTAHPLRAALPVAQRTAQGDWAAIEIVVVEIETAGGQVGVGECLARRGCAA
jgi:D-galactarolactone cycloisomerase